MSRRDPIVETRRARDFLDELMRRARIWIPDWELNEDSADVGHALLQIAARFNAEVAERLARMPEKNARGLLSWLGLKGAAARAARVPVVFRLSARATAPVLARAPVKLQAAIGDYAIVFETEVEIQLAPGQLRCIVAVDSSADAFYLPAAGLANVEPDASLPGQWHTKSFAAVGATHLQLDPALGLVTDMLVEAGGAQYRIVEVNNDIVTIEPALEAGDGLAAGMAVNKVSAFVPFGATARNRQQHVLYLGHTELLDLEAAADIEVSGVAGLPADVVWEYWGKRKDAAGEPADAGGGAANWQALTPTPVQDRHSIVLHKEKGSVELCQVGTVQSRWIRARLATVDAVTPAVEEITLKINPGSTGQPCAFDKDPAQSAPQLDGIANTMPLVLDQPFYPFGQEPRQFDAFYLGSAEAFSKKGAHVSLCFQVASATLGPLGLLRNGKLANQIMAGVGKDRLLYLLHIDPATGRVNVYEKRKPLQPPLPFAGADNPPKARIVLNTAPASRPALWARDNEFFVAVAAGQEVWVWHEILDNPKQSGWQPYGQLGLSDQDAIKSIVYVGVKPCLVVLYGADLFETAPESNVWTRIGKLTDADTKIEIEWTALAPIQSGDGDPDELVAISTSKHAYRLWRTAAIWQAEKIGTKKFETTVQPLAWRDKDLGIVVVGASQDTDGDANKDPHQLLVIQEGLVKTIPLKLNDKDVTFFGSVLDTFIGADGQRHVVMLADTLQGEPIVLGWWWSREHDLLYQIADAPSATRMGNAGPIVAGGWLVIPGANSDLLVGPTAPQRLLSLPVDTARGVTDALIDADPALAVGDRILPRKAAPFKVLRTIESIALDGAQKMYLLALPFDHRVDGLIRYACAKEGSKATIKPRTDRVRRVVLELEEADDQLIAGQWLLIVGDHGEGLYEIADLDQDNPLQVPLKKGPSENAGAVRYWAPAPLSARVAQLLRVTLPPVDDWTADMLKSAWFSLPGHKPERQQALASVLQQNRSALLAFARPWSVRPTSLTAESMTVTTLTKQLGDTSSNPELSWEYWNGTGWWTINQVEDGTARLRKDGKVSLHVPSDLRATDWGGKTNFWIRARLVGGDYGREKITVIQIEGKDKRTEQTIDRSTDDIHAPLVVQLQLRYSVDAPTLPTWLLTQDSGSIRDQSDANRTQGATVDLFVPLSVALAGLEAQAAPAAVLPAMSAHCDCATGPAARADTDAAGAGDSPAPAPAPGRALYLGFTERLHGGPLRLLFKAGAEQDHDRFAPLRIEAVDAGRVAPVVASDDTRAFGETGLLTFALPAPPQATALFGQALYWMRLRPALAPGASDAGWQPDIRGLYLNAVWAQAAETQEFEMLGSSDGAPNQVVFLARPPVLDNTLELRVREPLGDEEREQLRQTGADTVNSAVPGQPGDWVRWRQVGDPADSGPGERVYAFDAASGEIRFGDGLHGAIVPIGRDAVMAFRYQRTESGMGTGSAPANAVVDGASLSIVTPVESVEAVFAAGDAAGGTDAEDAARVLRFGAPRLRHRERVVTAADLEQMALQIAPEVAQARSLRYLRSAGGVRLVIVMRGSERAASRAQKRELRHALLAAAAPLLARKGALDLVDPVLRPISMRLVLSTESLDYSGQVATAATAAVRAWFDAATGGANGQGWLLGQAPVASDLAACLLDLPHLAGIVDVGLFESAADGTLVPARATVRPHELAVVGDIDVHIVTQETMP